MQRRGGADRVVHRTQLSRRTQKNRALRLRLCRADRSRTPENLFAIVTLVMAHTVSAKMVAAAIDGREVLVATDDGFVRTSPPSPFLCRRLSGFSGNDEKQARRCDVQASHIVGVCFSTLATVVVSNFSSYTPPSANSSVWEAF